MSLCQNCKARDSIGHDISPRIYCKINEQGEHHCEDGPALELKNGSKLWYKNGQKHRIIRNQGKS